MFTIVPIEYTISSLLFLWWQVSEVFNFTQDDLLTEDMLILNTHAEIFVWVGHSVESKEKQTAFEIGQVLILWQIHFLLSITMLIVSLIIGFLVYLNFPEIQRVSNKFGRFVSRCTTVQGHRGKRTAFLHYVLCLGFCKSYCMYCCFNFLRLFVIGV